MKHTTNSKITSFYTDYIKGLHFVGEATIGHYSTTGHTLFINQYKTDPVKGGIFVDHELVIEGQYKDLVELFLDQTTRNGNHIDWSFWTNRDAVEYLWGVTPKFVFDNYKKQNEQSSKTEYDFALEAKWHLGLFDEFMCGMNNIQADKKFNDRH